MTVATLPVRMVASVLPADLAALGQECRALEKAGVDRIHWDIMDGRFVPNMTFGPDTVAACRRAVGVGFEAHLMVAEPDRLLGRWIEAGCEYVIVHAESDGRLPHILDRIRELGGRAGLALNPATPLGVAESLLDQLDLLLVMTVNPGFGGQPYLQSMEPKLRAARRLLDERAPHVELEIDGGVASETIERAARAGARTFCTGSSLFAGRADLGGALARLRDQAAAGRP